MAATCRLPPFLYFLHSALAELTRSILNPFNVLEIRRLALKWIALIVDFSLARRH